MVRPLRGAPRRVAGAARTGAPDACRPARLVTNPLPPCCLTQTIRAGGQFYVNHFPPGERLRRCEGVGIQRKFANWFKYREGVTEGKANFECSAGQGFLSVNL